MWEREVKKINFRIDLSEESQVKGLTKNKDVNNYALLHIPTIIHADK